MTIASNALAPAGSRHEPNCPVGVHKNRNGASVRVLVPIPPSPSYALFDPPRLESPEVKCHRLTLKGLLDVPAWDNNCLMPFDPKSCRDYSKIGLKIRDGLLIYLRPSLILYIRIAFSVKITLYLNSTFSSHAAKIHDHQPQ